MKRVIVIGGGFAGSLVAKKLERKFEVVLIDAKDYFEFTPGILRILSSPAHKDKIQAFHRDYLKNSEIVKGTVKSIDKKNVLVNNKKIPYDYLVICSGSRYAAPIKENNMVLADHVSNLEKKYRDILKSGRILIIGGGLVGIELAGEIHDMNKNKEIIIIHAAPRLIERSPIKASEYARKFLEKRNVRIIFDEFFMGKEKGNYITDKKTKIKADLLFACTGIRANSEFMLKNFGDILNRRGQIVVDRHLHIIGTRNIFAAGDVNDTPVEKTAQNAKIQAHTVIKNIKMSEKGRKLRGYRAKVTPMLISLGKWDGLLVWKNFVMAGFFVGILKRFVEFSNMAKYKKSL
ncbi:MAG TPA: FAD-dependent oxidoreductase [Candidatus Omnitrophota bacterium]|nr:FAD-dependent oxidoreductase [Candidatus Omnitrophota bacterium]